MDQSSRLCRRGGVCPHLGWLSLSVLGPRRAGYGEQDRRIRAERKQRAVRSADLTALKPRLKIRSARYLRRADCAFEPGDDGAYGVMLGIARPIRAHRVYPIVDECQLPDRRRGPPRRNKNRATHAGAE